MLADEIQSHMHVCIVPWVCTNCEHNIMHQWPLRCTSTQFSWVWVKVVLIRMHTCHKLWTKVCEIRQNFKRDLTKFCEVFLNNTLGLPQYCLKSFFFFFFSCKKLVKPRTVCDLWLFVHKIWCKMVWKFCEIWILYGNCLLDGPNSVRFYLTVWGMACMGISRIFSTITFITLLGLTCFIIYIFFFSEKNRILQLSNELCDSYLILGLFWTEIGHHSRCQVLSFMPSLWRKTVYFVDLKGTKTKRKLEWNTKTYFRRIRCQDLF